MSLFKFGNFLQFFQVFFSDASPYALSFLLSISIYDMFKNNVEKLKPFLRKTPYLQIHINLFLVAKQLYEPLMSVCIYLCMYNTFLSC